MNGRWGSGKTYFLNRLREKSKKYKYIEMDFWGEEISEKNFTLIAKKLKPVCFFCYKLAYPTIVIIISAVITFLSYLFTDDLFTTSVFTNNMVIIFFFFLIVALLLQFKDYFSSPDILEKRSKNLIRNFSDKNKIIIIDDFDRISSQDRQNLYAIINLLKSNQNKIIVVGDIIQIDKDIRDGFVRKIIDYRYDIDNLHSTQYLYSKIEDKLQKIKVDTSSIEIILLRSDFINKKKNIPRL
ncbi:KAP family P-loop domain-containing protein [Jeotgalicoccus aerolatus]|uniref:KAP family P-loop domain-containing protein n=1 Tax=Jeotgalicoccus aerolatus TaxID=709510 RepID=A0A1G9ESR5_9STAP|nr:P-loop NTPase fold protein [Jeotgalicoccus aerolatus]SDK79189.1 KAP family P-loop domain-containing protein [Jeotgalicoccus aerolatus]